MIKKLKSEVMPEVDASRFTFSNASWIFTDELDADANGDPEEDGVFKDDDVAAADEDAVDVDAAAVAAGDDDGAAVAAAAAGDDVAAATAAAAASSCSNPNG